MLLGCISNAYGNDAYEDGAFIPNAYSLNAFEMHFKCIEE
jgi:hypothetical protein